MKNKSRSASLQIVQELRDAVAQSFKVESSVLLNLIDALVVGPRPESAVEIALSPAFGYDFSNVYAACYRSALELADDLSQDDWLQGTRAARLAWLEAQNVPSPNPATGKWNIRILDATDYPRPKTTTVELGYVHSAQGMTRGHGLSMLSQRVGEGSWTLPLEIGWIPPKTHPIAYGVAQIEQFVERHGWKSDQALVVDAQYTVATFLKPIQTLGISTLGRVANNRVFYLPPPKYKGFGRPPVRGRKIKLSDERTLPKIDQQEVIELEDGGRIEISRWDDVRMRQWPGQPLALYRVIEYRADGSRRYQRPLWLIFVPATQETELPTPRQAQAMYEERFGIEMRQTQPIKMIWCPLRLLRLAINGLRSRFKRENEVNVNLFSRDNYFLDQALRHGLALFKRESIEIVAEQFPKGLGVVNDLLPMNGLLSSVRQ